MSSHHAEYLAIALPMTNQTSHKAKHYRSPLADLRYAEDQRRMAAYRRGLMRTAVYPYARIITGFLSGTPGTPFRNETETYRHLKVPMLALLLPNHHSDKLSAIVGYCRTQDMRVEYLPWDQQVMLIICRNDGDWMTLKIVFPYLC